MYLTGWITVLNKRKVKPHVKHQLFTNTCMSRDHETGTAANSTADHQDTQKRYSYDKSNVYINTQTCQS